MITADELRGLLPANLPRGIKRVHSMDEDPLEKHRLRQRLRMRRLRREKPEELRQARRDWAKKNRKKLDEKKRLWAQKNRERALQIGRKASRKWREKLTPEQKAYWRAKGRDYFLANKDRINARRRELTRLKRENCNPTQ